jgi:hypothetical protein
LFRFRGNETSSKVLIAQYLAGPVEVRLSDDDETAELIFRTAQGPVSIVITGSMLKDMLEDLSRALDASAPSQEQRTF